jgi:hypothetical protein
MKEYPVDAATMRKLEHEARAAGRTLAEAIRVTMGGERYGFAVFLFAFGERGEMTYVSNANRRDMVKMLMEFIAKNPPEQTWDEQHG